MFEVSEQTQSFWGFFGEQFFFGGGSKEQILGAAAYITMHIVKR